MEQKAKWGIKRQRNKLTSVLLSVVLAGTLLTGCGKETQPIEETLGETTEVFDTYMMSPSGVLRGDSYGYLHFYDRESGQTAYLCNQAGCLHQDANCGAYLNNLYGAFYYNDNLYYIRSTVDENERVIYQMLRANRYGEERQLLAEFTPFPFPLYDATQYEGKLYFLGHDWDYEEDTAEKGLYSVDLESGEFTQIEYVEGYNIDYPLMEQDQFYLTDRYLYRLYYAANMDVNNFLNIETGELEEIDWSELVYTILLYRTDRETGESELLIKEVEEWGEHVGLQILEAHEEELIVCMYNEVIRYENGEEAEVLYEYTGEDSMWALTRLGDEYLLCENENPLESSFHILRDWEEVDSFSAPEKRCSCYGKTGNTIYFGANGGLYAMDYEAFLNGSYEFEHIDL